MLAALARFPFEKIRIIFMRVMAAVWMAEGLFAWAIILGIARALQVKNPALHPRLSEGGYLTRDSRMVERKKYGHKKARRSFQFSKR